MKTLIIEGFQVETNLDEQDVFNRLYPSNEYREEDIILNLKDQLVKGSRLMDFVEEVAINGTPVTDYFYANRMGYKKRYLEPYNWRATKKALTLSYTGAMGGGEWYAKVLLT